MCKILSKSICLHIAGGVIDFAILWAYVDQSTIQFSFYLDMEFALYGQLWNRVYCIKLFFAHFRFFTIWIPSHCSRCPGCQFGCSNRRETTVVLGFCEVVIPKSHLNVFTVTIRKLLTSTKLIHVMFFNLTEFL